MFQYEILPLENILLNLSNKSYFYYVELESIVSRQSETIAKMARFVKLISKYGGLTIHIIMMFRSSENNILFYILYFYRTIGSRGITLFLPVPPII